MKKYLSSQKTRLKRLPSSVSEKIGLIIVMFVIIIFFTITTRGLFFNLANPKNIINILQASVLTGVVATGVTFVIITGGIDLSVSGNCVLCAVTAALMMEKGVSWQVSMITILFVGTAIGLFNGLAVTKIHMVPFVTTLATFNITEGIAKTITNSRTITGLPSSMTIFGQGKLFGWLPVSVIILLIVFVIGSLLLSKTNYGRKLYAVGGNTKAAWLAGINTTNITLTAYMLSGLASAIGANIVISRLQSASLSIASGLELDVVAACVIGGSSLSGGRGTISGTLIGTIIISMINNGLNLMGVQSSVQLISKGTIIFIVVAYDSIRRIKAQSN